MIKLNQIFRKVMLHRKLRKMRVGDNMWMTSYGYYVITRLPRDYMLTSPGIHANKQVLSASMLVDQLVENNVRKLP